MLGANKLISFKPILLFVRIHSARKTPISNGDATGIVLALVHTFAGSPCAIPID